MKKIDRDIILKELVDGHPKHIRQIEAALNFTIDKKIISRILNKCNKVERLSYFQPIYKLKVKFVLGNKEVKSQYIKEKKSSVMVSAQDKNR